MTNNYKMFAPYFAMMYQVFHGSRSEFKSFVEHWTLRGWRFVGAVTVCNDTLDGVSGDWEGSLTTTFVYFE